ncbi:MAG: protein-L-isoaspartate O-methyltransferase [Gammaproteobacteria bacterium]|nr:protein-L-isoaspartate O-methyltransferase [Gammaproteobacteria bacterium]
MIDQQIRAWGVSNKSVLDTLRAVPRENFVPETYRNMAFADWRIPLGHNEFMMAPKVEARMLQALGPRVGDDALEVGTGSGFVAACLAELCNHVTTIDIHGDFIRQANQVFKENNIVNIETEQQSVFSFVSDKVFDVIAVTASLPELTAELKTNWLQMLNVGGRLFVTVGQSPVMQAKLLTKVDDHTASETILFETDLPPLAGSRSSSTFEF